ncbi:hypothetical protein NESM_000870500 [Novymonas esmeraldas]|uniref:Uncharacterized protein n=1 Tax=Novymonas esmeraldas TaxID=1808958 RepID=A0AAW0F1S0_9TRYP
MSPIHAKRFEALGLGVSTTADGAAVESSCSSAMPASAASSRPPYSPLHSRSGSGRGSRCSPVAAMEEPRRGGPASEHDLSSAASSVVAAAARESWPLSRTSSPRGLAASQLLGRMSTSVCIESSDAPRTAAVARAPTPRGGDNASMAASRDDPNTMSNLSVAPAVVAPAATVAAGGGVVGYVRALPRRLVSAAVPPLRMCRERLRRMTIKQMLWVILLVALVMVGNFMQIVMLNFWLISFPADGTPGNYTAFAVPGIFFAVLFALLFGAYAVVRRPSLQFARHAHGWGILVGVGFCDAFNSWMATYAASYTSEVLQALFANLCPLYAVFLCKWILQDTRRYANAYIVSVFVLTICGILAASLYGLIKDHNMGEGNWWILIYFLSMPFRVLMNVWQSLYMIVYTRDPKFVPWLRVRLATEEDAAAASPAVAAAAGVAGLRGETNNDDGTPDTSDTCIAGVDVVAQGCAPLTKKVTASAVPRNGVDAVEAGDDCDAEELDCDAPQTRATLSTAAVVSLREPIASFAEVRDAMGSRHSEDESGSGGDNNTPTASTAPPLPTQTMFTVRYNQGEDTIVKLVMLAGETVLQMCFTLCLLPADALPWWGNSKTVSATWGNFIEGVRCVFTIGDNFLYCFLYTLGFVFTYVGCAYLNHYSAALCSIVTQLSSPVTALMLVIVPSWNVQVDGDSPWYYNVIAILCLCVAALLYVVWEEVTEEEKVHTEYELKMNVLHVRPSSHEAPHAVTIHG